MDPGQATDDDGHAALLPDTRQRSERVWAIEGCKHERAHHVHPVAAVQTEWSVWRPVDADLLATARRLGVGLAAWSPLRGGFLTGGVTSVEDGDFRRNAPRFADGNLQVNNRYAPVRAGWRLDLTPGQLARAGLLAQDSHVVPIPGSRTPEHIVEKVEAGRVELNPDTLAAVDEALRGPTPAGASML